MSKLARIQYHVGIAMRDNSELRLHKNRHKLYLTVVNLMQRQVSPESVSRAQRKLWEKALLAAQAGDYSLADNFIPKNKVDRIEWAMKRKKYQEEYINFFVKQNGGEINE